MSNSNLQAQHLHNNFQDSIELHQSIAELKSIQLQLRCRKKDHEQSDKKHCIEIFFEPSSC